MEDFLPFNTVKLHVARGLRGPKSYNFTLLKPKVSLLKYITPTPTMPDFLLLERERTRRIYDLPRLSQH